LVKRPGTKKFILRLLYSGKWHWLHLTLGEKRESVPRTARASSFERRSKSFKKKMFQNFFFNIDALAERASM
jgi:hypothetical protein